MACSFVQEDAMSEEKKHITPGLRALLQGLAAGNDMYVLISACTREPYVYCNPETFDDQVYLYLDEEEAKAGGKTHLEQKIPVNIAKLDGKLMLRFFTGLYTMGVNALLVTYQGEETLIQLEDVVKKKKQDQMPDGSVWIENPQLHLTLLYFAQELRKPEGEKDMAQMQELQEEMGAVFKTGTYVAAVQQEEKGIPLLKLEDGKTYQPLFTDVIQFQRFNQGDKFRPVVIEAASLSKALPPGTSGVVLNPMGVKLPLTLAVPQAARKPSQTEPEN